LEEVMPNRSLPADKMIDFLADEDQYWQRIVDDPRQWAAKKMQHRSAQTQNSKRRRTITTYLASNKLFTASIPEEQTLSDTDKTNTSTVSDTASVSDSDIIDLVDDAIDFSQPEATSRSESPARSVTPDESPEFSRVFTARKSTYKRTPVEPKDLCASCRRVKANGACTLHMCKPCCIDSSAYCALTDHKRNKKGARQLFTVSPTSAPVNVPGESQLALENERKMRAAIATKGRVFISYKGDSLCRNISPHSIEGSKEGLLVRAMDHTKNGERSFYVAKITRIEDTPWEVPQGMQLYNKA
jgi:hypothetical protein